MMGRAQIGRALLGLGLLGLGARLLTGCGDFKGFSCSDPMCSMRARNDEKLNCCPPVLEEVRPSGTSGGSVIGTGKTQVTLRGWNFAPDAMAQVTSTGQPQPTAKGAVAPCADNGDQDCLLIELGAAMNGQKTQVQVANPKGSKERLSGTKELLRQDQLQFAAQVSTDSTSNAALQEPLWARAVTLLNPTGKDIPGVLVLNQYKASPPPDGQLKQHTLSTSGALTFNVGFFAGAIKPTQIATISVTKAPYSDLVGLFKNMTSLAMNLGYAQFDSEANTYTYSLTDSTKQLRLPTGVSLAADLAPMPLVAANTAADGGYVIALALKDGAAVWVGQKGQDPTQITPTHVMLGSAPLALLVEDLVGDGKLEIAYRLGTGMGTRNVMYLDGDYTAKTAKLWGTSPQDLSDGQGTLAAVDVNFDNVRDLVAIPADQSGFFIFDRTQPLGQTLVPLRKPDGGGQVQSVTIGAGGAVPSPVNPYILTTMPAQNKLVLWH